jgi:hypothetical protein
MPSDVEDSRELGRSAEKILKLLSLLPYVSFAFQEILAGLVVLGILDRERVNGRLSPGRGGRHNLKMRCELRVGMDKLRKIPTGLLAVGED